MHDVRIVDNRATRAPMRLVVQNVSRRDWRGLLLLPRFSLCQSCCFRGIRRERARGRSRVRNTEALRSSRSMV